MNPDTMTVDECREWLAKDDEWNVFATDGYGNATAWINEKYKTCGVVLNHPFPLTIDGAAKAMPKEFWYKVCVNPRGRVDAYAERGFTSIDVAATDELTARYRLAVKCRMALKTWNE